MGSSESKLNTLASETKAELPYKPTRVSELIDPRSPSVGIDRTPIQVNDGVKGSTEVKTVLPEVEIDPRSPSFGVSRTPVREVMRATVGTFARRLGLLFHSDAENKVQRKDLSKMDDAKTEEVASTEPLLTPQPSDTLSSLDTRALMLETPLEPLPQSSGSPFLHLEDPQLEVELETAPDISYEEAEEARETPIHKRLSLSLVACLEGAASTQVYEDVSNSSFGETIENGDVDSKMQMTEDHSYAMGPVPVSFPVEPPADDAQTPETTQFEEVTMSPIQTEEMKVVQAPTVPLPSTSSTPAQSEVASPRPRPIRCPTIDAKSPSQVVFKPQWLGKGFGGAGQRVKAQGNGIKGGSSPLALQVAVKNVTNENKSQAGKAKSKGNEGRPPLQILKETNSPRSQQAQLKMKLSTPEKRRSAHSERRMLSVAVDKENR